MSIFDLAEEAVPTLQEAKTCLDFVRTSIGMLKDLDETDDRYLVLAAEYAKSMFASLLVLDFYLTECFSNDAGKINSIELARFFFEPHEDWVKKLVGKGSLTVKWNEESVTLSTESDRVYAKWCKINPDAAELS